LIAATASEALHVLDALLYHRSEVQIRRHHTDVVDTRSLGRKSEKCSANPARVGGTGMDLAITAPFGSEATKARRPMI
jgi:hypothetical protein